MTNNDIKRDESGAIITRRNETAIQQARERKLLSRRTQLHRSTQEDISHNVRILEEKFERLELKFNQILQRLTENE